MPGLFSSLPGVEGAEFPWVPGPNDTPVRYELADMDSGDLISGTCAPNTFFNPSDKKVFFGSKYMCPADWKFSEGKCFAPYSYKGPCPLIASFANPVFRGGVSKFKPKVIVEGEKRIGMGAKNKSMFQRMKDKLTGAKPPIEISPFPNSQMIANSMTFRHEPQIEYTYPFWTQKRKDEFADFCGVRWSCPAKCEQDLNVCPYSDPPEGSNSSFSGNKTGAKGAVQWKPLSKLDPEARAKAEENMKSVSDPVLKAAIESDEVTACVPPPGYRTPALDPKAA
jgi:hypothetical protein